MARALARTVNVQPAKSVEELTDRQKLILQFATNPELFVRELFHVEPEKWQIEALKAIAENDRIAIRSGHGVGKTAFLAWVIIWWLLTRYPARIACTANTANQLSDVLWGELDKWVRQLPEGFRKLLELKADYLVFLDDPKQCFAVARTARKEQPEAFQGMHSPNMLFIVDEASGVDDIIFEVGRGAMSSHGAKTVMTGNPTRTNGYFFNAFHEMRKFWHTMHVPCSASTQCSPKYIEECKEEYGEDSNAFRVRVLGEFPIEGDDIIIPLHLVEAAVTRQVDMIPSDEVWGVDVARFGDDRSCLAKRCANHLIEPIKWWQGKDIMQLTGLIVNEWNNAKKKPGAIFVDSIGIGAGVVDRLREMNYPVRGINVAETPSIQDKFMRMRDELWWEARNWFKGLDVKIPNDGKLISELTLPTFEYTSNGKLKIESKEETKKRTAKSASSLGKSPDFADAFVLTFAARSMVFRKPKPIAYPKLGIV